MIDGGTGTFCGAVVGLIIGIFVFLCIGADKENIFGKVISKGNPKVGFILWAGCLFVGAMVGSTFPAPEYYTTHTPIYSAGDAIGSYGSFVLGTGTLQSDPVFIYYVGDNAVGYTMEYKSARYSRIFMDEDTKPYLKGNCVHEWGDFI